MFRVLYYQEELRNTLWIGPVVGMIHLLPSSGFLLFTAWQVTDMGVSKFLTFLSTSPSFGLTLGYMSLMFACATALVICQFRFKSQPWSSLVVTYWSMAILMVLTIQAPCCIVLPLNVFLFLRVRECYLAARELVDLGFDLRNLPDY